MGPGVGRSVGIGRRPSPPRRRLGRAARRLAHLAIGHWRGLGHPVDGLEDDADGDPVVDGITDARELDDEGERARQRPLVVGIWCSAKPPGRGPAARTPGAAAERAAGGRPGRSARRTPTASTGRRRRRTLRRPHRLVDGRELRVRVALRERSAADDPKTLSAARPSPSRPRQDRVDPVEQHGGARREVVVLEVEVSGGRDAALPRPPPRRSAGPRPGCGHPRPAPSPRTTRSARWRPRASRRDRWAALRRRPGASRWSSFDRRPTTACDLPSMRCATLRARRARMAPRALGNTPHRGTYRFGGVRSRRRCSAAKNPYGSPAGSSASLSSSTRACEALLEGLRASRWSRARSATDHRTSEPGYSATSARNASTTPGHRRAVAPSTVHDLPVADTATRSTPACPAVPVPARETPSRRAAGLVQHGSGVSVQRRRQSSLVELGSRHRRRMRRRSRFTSAVPRRGGWPAFHVGIVA